MSFLKPFRELYMIGPEISLPAKVDNAELLRRLGYTDGLQTRMSWIEARSGIESRHWVDPQTACSDLAIEAGHKIMAKKPSALEIGHLVLATVSGDHISPPSSPLVQAGLALPHCGAYDLAAACAGFATALYAVGSQTLATEENQLLINSEIRSKFLNPKDLGTAILFGDGAAAVILSLKPTAANWKIKGVLTQVQGEFHDLITIPAGGSRQPVQKELSEDHYFLQMRQGAKVFLSALSAMKQMAADLLQRLEISIDDITWLVPHQANGVLIQALAKEMNFPIEKTWNVIRTIGNTSGASSPIALAKLREQKNLQKGDLVLNVSAGGGGFAAAALFEAL